MKKFLDLIINKKVLLGLALIIMVLSNILTVVNVYTGISKPYTTRYLTLITLIVFILHLVLMGINSIINKEKIIVLIKIFLLFSAAYLIYKYFKDIPRYFKHNNLTNLLLQVLLVIELMVLVFKTSISNFRTNITKMISIFIILLTLLTLMIINVNNHDITLFYKFSLWLNVSLLIFYLNNIVIVKRKNNANILSYITHVLLVLYYIVSLILVRTGNYNVSYPKILFQLIVYLFIISNLTKLMNKQEKYQTNDYIKLLLVLALIFMLFLTMNHKISSVYNINLIVVSILIFITILLDLNKRVNLFLIITTTIVLLIPILFFNNVNQTFFMISMSLGSVLLTANYVKTKVKELN